MDPSEIAGADLPVRFGRYELQRVIGEGGMGRVFAAELLGPAGFRKKVAIKVLRPALQLRAGQESTDLAREARLGGLVSHPNVVETWELGEVGGQLFLAMALVDGPSLLDIVRRRGRLSPRAVLEAGTHVALALAHIHSVEVPGAARGLVHCDVKPSNVLVDPASGQARLADLGVGALRSAVALRSDRRGTPSYMSPEQVAGGALDGRSDLFALGIVLWEIATGRRLFRRDTAEASVSAILHCEDTVRPLLGMLDPLQPGMAEVIGRCLRADPADRWPDGRTLSAALEALTANAPGPPIGDYAGGSVTAAPTPTAPTSSRGARLDPAAPTVLGRPPTNVGAEPDAFVGREADLGHLGELFHGRGARLVTLKGTGGTGKTRLSRRFAVHALASFPGGAWFCDLTQARTRQETLFAVAGALGMPIVGKDDEALPTQLGLAIAGRGRLLLVLDNLEQIVELAAPVLSTWLALAPDARFLVTSREPLRIAGEEVVELAPLPPDEAVALLRARAGQPGPWTDDEPALRAIAARLDGLPLALELAAARARTVAPAQLLERISAKLDLLRSGRRGAPARQATLRGAIEWSWSMLEPWEQAAMAQLSVFRGGFFLDDAEGVLDLTRWPDAPWSIDVVDALWSRSLLVSRDLDGRPRFAMYEAIREFALEHLDPTDPVRDRHARRYAELGSAARLAHLVGPRAGDELHALALEVDNLVAATTHALARGEADVAARAALGAGNVFHRMGPYEAGLDLLVKVLAGPTPAVRADLVQLACTTAANAGRLDLALRIANDELAHAGGDLVLEGVALCGLAYATQGRGDPHAALVHANAACARFEAAGHTGHLAATRGLVGRLHTDCGDYAEGERCQRDALEMARRIGDRALEGTCLGGIGLVRQYQADDASAEQFLRDAAAVLAEIGDRPRLGRVRGNLAIAARRLGRHEDARREYEAAIALYREVGSRSDEGQALLNLGILHRMEGDLELAERRTREGEALAVWIGNDRLRALGRGNLGLVHRSRADLPAARAAFEEAIAISDRLGAVRLVTVYLFDLAALEADAGEFARACTTFEGSLARLAVAPDTSVRVSGSPTYARCLGFAGRAAEGEQHVRATLGAVGGHGTRIVEADAWFSLARIRFDQGDAEEAARHVASALEAIGRAQRILRAGMLTHAAEIAVARGRSDEARAYLDEALSFAGRGDAELSLRLRVVRAVLAAEAGDAVSSGRELHDAIVAFEARGLAVAAIDARAARIGVAHRLGLDPDDDRRAIAGWIDRSGCPTSPLARHLGSR